MSLMRERTRGQRTDVSVQIVNPFKANLWFVIFCYVRFTWPNLKLAQYNSWNQVMKLVYLSSLCLWRVSRIHCAETSSQWKCRSLKDCYWKQNWIWLMIRFSFVFSNVFSLIAMYDRRKRNICDNMCIMWWFQLEVEGKACVRFVQQWEEIYETENVNFLFESK